MIIKSMARKRPSFKQLIAYMGRDAGTSFTRNLYDGGDHPVRIAHAFERNYVHLPTRKNGNALYHEVIVLPPQPGLSKAQQDTILRELAERYCTLRAPDNLAYGRIHQDTDHSHIHLMISANPARSSRRVRLSKARFAEIQAQLDQEARIRFPELQDQPVYDRVAKARSDIKVRTRETAQTRRSGLPSRKQRVRDQVEAAFATAQSNADLAYQLQQEGLEFYRRGSRVGVRDLSSGARHRLETLGLMNSLQELERRWQVQQKQAAPKPIDRAAAPTLTPPQREPKRSQPVPAMRKPVERSSKSSDPVRADDEPEQDPRAAELLRQRQALSDRADQALRDFDSER